MPSAKLTVEDDAIFQSAVEAVRFALTLTSRPPRPAMRRMLNAAASHREFTELDPTLQAWRILNIVRGGGRLSMAVMTATAAPRNKPCHCQRACCSGKLQNREWDRAVEIIAEAVLVNGISKASYVLRVACVQKVFGEKVSRKQIAEDLCIDEATVAKHFKSIQRWLRGGRFRQNELTPGVEQRVWRNAQDALRAEWLVR